MLTLFTKDSSRMGNAIIIREVEPSNQSMKDYLKGRPLWLIETDFGNRFRYTDREIDEAFHRGIHCSYEQWKSDREELRRQHAIEDDPENHPS